MTQVRIADATDAARWDRYILGCEQASPYHLCAWSDAVQATYGHESIRLIAERNGNVVGVFPLIHFKTPLVSNFICSLPYCDIGGVLADDQSVTESLRQAALDVVGDRKATSLHVRSRGERAATIEGDFTGKVSMLLELPEDAEALMASFKAKLRSQIRKAEKNGLTFRSGNTRNDLAEFYSVLAANMRDLGSPVHSRSWFEALRSRYGKQVEICLVYKGDLPVGAGFLLICNDSAAIPWASTLGAYNRLAPNMLLYWNLLRIAIERQCRVFDFGRSTFGEGTYRFKKQWGAVPAPLSWADYAVDGSVIPAEDSSTDSSRSLAQSVWQRLPLWLANAIGPRVRGHISL